MDAKQSTKQLVEQYLQFFALPGSSFSDLRAILADDFRFESPLGNFASADVFIQDLKRDLLEISSLNLRQIIADENSACALYDVESRNPEIGHLVFSEWFEIKDGKIATVKSTYDASDIKRSMAQI